MESSIYQFLTTVDALNCIIKKNMGGSEDWNASGHGFKTS